MSRDRIEEAGGQNLYISVRNSPQSYIDLLGNTWTSPRREGGARAFIECECGDTVAGLEGTGLLAFDFREFGKWLMPADRKGPLRRKDEAAAQARKFSIPNTIYIGFGYLSPLERVFIWPHYPVAGLQVAALRHGGAKVVYDSEIQWSEMRSYLGDPDTHGISYFGHGPATTLGKDGHPFPMDDRAFMNASEAVGFLDHGLWMFFHHGCGSVNHAAGGAAQQKSWRDLVTNKGVFMGSTVDLGDPYEVLAGMVTLAGTYVPAKGQP